jgi:WD40 repeat protein
MLIGDTVVLGKKIPISPVTFLAIILGLSNLIHQLAKRSWAEANHILTSTSTMTPTHLMADLILPFVADRGTWNSVCSASKELRSAAKKMTPPWPAKAFNLEHPAFHVSFSPSGSQLAFCINNDNTGQFVVHVLDSWGKEALLGGHTGCMHCLECSLDGENLASGSDDNSIQIWHAESFHATSSQTRRERSTRTPQQADKILLGGRSIFVALSFSRTDSNLFASAGGHGEIKVWNVNEQSCIHTFDPRRGRIRPLLFVGGADIAYIAGTRDGSIIRLWRSQFSSDLASETIGEADRGGLSPHAVLSPSGSFLATYVSSRTGDGFVSTLALYELETMTKTQSVVMPDFTAVCVAMTSDSKQLVVCDFTGKIRLLQTNDFSVQRDLEASAMPPVWSVAFDPTFRFLAIGCQDSKFELRSLQCRRSAIYL